MIKDYSSQRAETEHKLNRMLDYHTLQREEVFEAKSQISEKHSQVEMIQRRILDSNDQIQDINRNILDLVRQEDILKDEIRLMEVKVDRLAEDRMISMENLERTQ